MKQPVFYQVIETSFKPVFAVESDNVLITLSTSAVLPAEWKDAVQSETEILHRCRLELAEYFAGKRFCFDLPLAPPKTVFQGKIREGLLSIPYGSTISYGELARRIGIPKGFQAAGQGVHVNPFAILVPCHRVIGSDGSLTGYAGGLDWKEFLLTHERRLDQSDQGTR